MIIQTLSGHEIEVEEIAPEPRDELAPSRKARSMGMRVLLLQLDGKIPNLALMRVAAHHRELGDEVEHRRAGNASAIEPEIFGTRPDRVYASLIFERTRPLAERLLVVRPDAIVGGTGWNLSLRLEDSTCHFPGVRYRVCGGCGYERALAGCRPRRRMLP